MNKTRKRNENEDNHQLVHYYHGSGLIELTDEETLKFGIMYSAKCKVCSIFMHKIPFVSLSVHASMNSYILSVDSLYFFSEHC